MVIIVTALLSDWIIGDGVLNAANGFDMERLGRSENDLLRDESREAGGDGDAVEGGTGGIAVDVMTHGERGDVDLQQINMYINKYLNKYINPIHHGHSWQLHKRHSNRTWTPSQINQKMLLFPSTNTGALTLIVSSSKALSPQIRKSQLPSQNVCTDLFAIAALRDNI